MNWGKNSKDKKKKREELGRLMEVSAEDPRSFRENLSKMKAISTR